ncbi:MAG: hypothetical protein LBR53_05125 [Deltaproteobacteria bacterium]|jgi:hypothetical protein|nr:hypothetical protein [Deltaproteobacteria bacterium]
MENNTLDNLVTENSWHNVYWFSRMLVNSDKYGAVGTTQSKRNNLIMLSKQLQCLLDKHEISVEEKISRSKKIIFDSLTTLYNQSSPKYKLIIQLAIDINDKIVTIKDVIVFIFVVQHIIMPINIAISIVPSNDREFTTVAAKDMLDSLGESAVGTIIHKWDDLGVLGCLNKERSLIVSEFKALYSILHDRKSQLTELDIAIILTSFVQEFERRLSQKRKSRAGQSLEDVFDFLFNYFNFTSHPAPDHFQTDIEVDKWFKCKDNWIIGISCKRTLRERWKQISGADKDTLSKFRIRHIWHLLTYDTDLSDDKITMLGQQRHIFYLLDSSDKYKNASKHIGMKDYVRPLSGLISDIRKEQS